ncbi:hypothetical protein HYC85_002007 [Camellia sinensis]|uniref:DUF632 domain-containing protein n=1 Tax=Camellia sinensis TaxID=4442 RepID=A0A7J7I9E2_CAMSI|nr:hypothetical protein HYC85_002007 [Camellia sinensis]
MQEKEVGENLGSPLLMNMKNTIQVNACRAKQVRSCDAARSTQGTIRFSIPDSGVNPLLRHVAATGWVLPGKVTDRPDKAWWKGVQQAKRYGLSDRAMTSANNEALTGMWTLMVDCHRKQFLAMLEGKTQLQIAQAAIERNSSIMAVRKLETDILNWATAFTYWISTQKSFVKFLNGCLMKCLLKEPEETPDGIAPFSPTRLGAPPIFITCNDWYNAIENVSGAGVSKAMHEFASMLNQLGKKLDEEKRQRLKVEYLAKDLEKRVKTLYEESGMNWEQYVLSNNAAAAEVTTESGILIPDGLHVDLKLMKNRLDDERARRMEAIMQANDISSQGFRAGLVRVFEALDGFSGEMLKALEQVRFPKGEGGADLTGMWTFMVDCHRKQFLAMLEAKAQFQAIERNSSIMAIRKLETDSELVPAQRIRRDARWTCALLSHKPWAPPIFITCNDWNNAIENVSEAGVSNAMHDFASMLNQLRKKLDEEKCQRLKVEYSAKDLEKRVKTLYEESGTGWEQYVLPNNAAATEVTTESGILIPDGLHVDLKPMRDRLNEEKARHVETIMQVDSMLEPICSLNVI